MEVDGGGRGTLLDGVWRFLSYSFGRRRPIINISVCIAPVAVGYGEERRLLQAWLRLVLVIAIPGVHFQSRDYEIGCRQSRDPGRPVSRAAVIFPAGVRQFRLARRHKSGWRRRQAFPAAAGGAR